LINERCPKCNVSKKVRVINWFEVGILSQQTGFDSRPGKSQKRAKAPAMINSLDA